MNRSLATVLLLVAWATGCSDAGASDASFATWFRELTGGAERGDGSWDDVKAGSLAALPVQRIVLRRSQASFFTSVEVEFVGGTQAFKHGAMADWPEERSGSLQADVPFHEFARLVWLIESLDLPPTSTSWESGASHGEQLTIAWTTPEGHTVELSDYGAAAPPEVGALAAAIETAARRLTWIPTGTADPADAR